MSGIVGRQHMAATMRNTRETLTDGKLYGCLIDRDLVHECKYAIPEIELLILLP